MGAKVVSKSNANSQQPDTTEQFEVSFITGIAISDITFFIDAG